MFTLGIDRLSGNCGSKAGGMSIEIQHEFVANGLFPRFVLLNAFSGLQPVTANVQALRTIFLLHLLYPSISCAKVMYYKLWVT